jgi:hypothetical protein
MMSSPGAQRRYSDRLRATEDRKSCAERMINPARSA